jgi:hypothetical protein
MEQTMPDAKPDPPPRRTFLAAGVVAASAARGMGRAAAGADIVGIDTSSAFLCGYLESRALALNQAGEER